ncbi:MAG: aspartate carbamoyltransferase regulatory subunit [Tissierellia bacterium]|nr:aspartate carbamoyltransferase regulatory subunit [Tissierellia bacterium]
MINVTKIKRGVVLDHIEAGKGYELFLALDLDELDEVVALLTNIPSHKYGKKDLIKIETGFEPDFKVLGLISPNTTVNIVEDGKLAKKYRMELPEEVEGILRCSNPVCITQQEEVPKIKFRLVDREKRAYACEYCDHVQIFKE